MRHEAREQDDEPGRSQVTRAFRGGRGAVRLVLATCAAVAALLAGPMTAGACPSLSRLRAFHGSAGSVSFSDTASGTDPGNGGIETVALNRSATSLHIALGGKLTARNGVTIFAGKTSGGGVSVSDAYTNTGTMLTGTESAGGPPDVAIPGAEAAVLVLFPRTCKYQLLISFGVNTTFSGSEAVRPGAAVTASVYSPQEHIPASLKLSGSATIDAYYTGCRSGPIPPEKGCYRFGGGWVTEFETLKLCRSVVAVNCEPGDEPQGMATFSWSLSPTLTLPKRIRHG